MAIESTGSTTDTQGEVDSYRLIQNLTPNRTFLCTDASGNVVVLIRLEADCLHKEMLHPSISDRLARVRELPHPRVATLRSVERWNGIACMVWIYLDGENWDETVRQNPAQFPALAASVAAAVGTLHDIGIVHGNLHGRNIIVRQDGQPWLTQVSPYLYADPAVDVAAVIQLLQDAGHHLPERMAMRLGQVLDQFDPATMGLKELSRAIGEIDEEESAEPTAAAASKDPEYRRQSLAAALLVSLLAMAIAVAARWSLHKPTSPASATIPLMKQ